MNQKKALTRSMDILLVITNLVFLIGLRTFASACGMKEDGTWMTCHWAMQALSGMAAVLLADSVLNLILQDPKIKTGIMAAMIPAAILCIILPENLIGLCMMDTMHCHTVMRPFSILMSMADLVLAAVGIIRAIRTQRKIS
jgi:hypothetical protein